jgi:hypothetical protein
MSDTPPNRVPIGPGRNYYDEAALIRVPAGKTIDRRRTPLMIKITGPVEPCFRGPAQEFAM